MMLEELRRRNYSAITTRNYLRVVTEFTKYFGKSPPQAWSQRTSKLSSLSTDRTQADTRHGSQRSSCAALLFYQDTQAASVPRFPALSPGPAPPTDGVES